MRNVYIYALRDPRTDDVRYVGRSVNPLARRTHHLHDPAPKMRAWVSELVRDDRRPVIQILEETTSAEADEKEAFWIGFLSGRGCALLNTCLVPRYEVKRKRNKRLRCPECGKRKKSYQRLCEVCFQKTAPRGGSK